MKWPKELKIERNKVNDDRYWIEMTFAYFFSTIITFFSCGYYRIQWPYVASGKVLDRYNKKRAKESKKSAKEIIKKQNKKVKGGFTANQYTATPTSQPIGQFGHNYVNKTSWWKYY